MIQSGLYFFARKWLLHLMAFAFFWLVIGDLVTMHQKVIFGFDPYGKEIPFAKSNNSPTKTKLDKGSKFDKFKDDFHIDAFIRKAIKITPTLVCIDFEFINTFTLFLSKTGSPLIALRAPPVI